MEGHPVHCWRKAQALNTYFASIFTNEDTSTLKKAKSDLPAQRTIVEVGDITFAKDEVFEALCSIDPDKSCGPDNVPGRLLKEAAPWIAEPLAHLFNLSMSTGSLPQDWTRANITPIFKKGDKHSLQLLACQSHKPHIQSHGTTHPFQTQ